MDTDSLLDQIAKEGGRRRTRPGAVQRHYVRDLDAAPLVWAAEDLTNLPRPALSSEARSRIEAQMLARARELGPAALGPAPQSRPARRSLFFAPRSATGLLALVVLISVVGTSTVAAASALPGDPLYPVKALTEEIQYETASAPSRPALRLELAQRRLNEVEALNRRGTVNDQALRALEVSTQAAMGAVQTLPPADQAQLLEKVVALTQRQTVILTTVLDRAPGKSHAAVTLALDAAAASHQKASTALMTLSAPAPTAAATGIAVATPTLPASGTPVPGATADANTAVPTLAMQSGPTPPGLAKTPQSPAVTPPGQVKTPGPQGNPGGPNGAPGQDKDKDNNGNKDKDKDKGKP